jgi:hypothetical protein
MGHRKVISAKFMNMISISSASDLFRIIRVLVSLLPWGKWYDLTLMTIISGIHSALQDASARFVLPILGCI